MAGKISIEAAHHIKLTVTDIARSRNFYADVLGFEVAVQVESITIMSSGTLLIGLSLAPAPEKAIPNDRFDENRVGLDHLSLSVVDRQALDDAARTLDELGIAHGEMIDLAPIGITIMSLRDPDNIQLELTAPLAS